MNCRIRTTSGLEQFSTTETKYYLSLPGSHIKQILIYIDFTTSDGRQIVRFGQLPVSNNVLPFCISTWSHHIVPQVYTAIIFPFEFWPLVSKLMRNMLQKVVTKGTFYQNKKMH